MVTGQGKGKEVKGSLSPRYLGFIIPTVDNSKARISDGSGVHIDQLYL